MKTLTGNLSAFRLSRNVSKETNIDISHDGRLTEHKDDIT